MIKARVNDVVLFHYEASDETGRITNHSHGGEGFAVLVGHRNVILGVDEALVGKAAGDQFEIKVPPEKAYGVYRSGWTQRVPKKYISGPLKLAKCDNVVLKTKDGYQEVTVIKVGRNVVDVDLNPPMSGKSLTFKIEVLSVRKASVEEISHHHVHGLGGHQH